MGSVDEGGPGKGPRVLIGAYACGPIDEPEAAAGWAFARAAAAVGEVVVVTRPRFRDAIDEALAADPEIRVALTVRYLDLPWPLTSWKKAPGGLYWYYALWQRQLGRLARVLHASEPFDLLHHVTFANDWLPCGLTAVDGVPLVWGPVGGASPSILRFARWLGARGTLVELGRGVTVGVLRAVFGNRIARRSAIVVAQNSDVAERFLSMSQTIVEPNAAIEAGLPVRRRERSTAGRRAVFVGRLLGWKGIRLAIATIAHPDCDPWILDVYGEGYQESAMRDLAARSGLGARVTFHGRRPRAEVLQAMAEADALLFPSFHDQAGWVAAEASAIGCPVVCLPLGGPALLGGSNAHVASLTGDLAANLARSLNEAAHDGGHPDLRWSATRLPDRVAEIYAVASVAGVVR